jgi:hypothetical protein
MSKKNCSFRRFVAVILSIFIILTLSLSFGGDVSASKYDMAPEYDFSNKILTNYLVPYAGFPANEVYCHEFEKVYPDSSDTSRYVYLDCGDVYGKGLFDENGQKLDDNDWLKEGKKYTYKAGFASKTKVSTKSAYSIKNYKIKTIGSGTFM